MNGERIAVSTGTDPSTWSIGLDSDLRTGFTGKARVLEALGRTVFNVRMLGSSARSLSLVAEGRALPCAASAYAAGGEAAHRPPLDFVQGA